jgi:prolyl-tRNA synthetase
MRASTLHAPTLKEAPKEAEVPSHALLLRAGYIRREAAGIYSYLPLAMRTLAKIGRIIREELERAGAQEVLLPTVQPAELWMESGRWEKYGPELLRLKDRKGAEFCYAPTAEEVITSLVRRDVRSYRQLPLNLFQVATKFRDEIRPRAGLMRGREFIMKDGYSFDVDEAAAQRTYQAMYDAYTRIFQRCGLAFRPVEADTGAIGGSRSHEFQVLAETGEDSIVSCAACGYTANVEKGEIKRPTDAIPSVAGGKHKVLPTPGKKSIEDVSAFLKLNPARILKTLYVDSDAGTALVLLRGDRELNEIKLRAVMKATWVQMKTDIGDLPVGYMGPVNLPAGFKARVIADDSVRGMKNFACGANEYDAHRVGVELDDLGLTETFDVAMAKGGDPCGRCGEALAFFRGIEVGHVFFLGTKYSEPMGCNFLDATGQERPMVMGCYGIGVTRIMASAIEQNHDQHGIKWPVPLAPFEVAILPLQADDDEVQTVATNLYEALRARGIEALLDDRPLRPGQKFADADLQGYPVQVMIGRRGLDQGGVEVKDRMSGARENVAVAEAADRLVSRILAARFGNA